MDAFNFGGDRKNTMVQDQKIALVQYSQSQHVMLQEVTRTFVEAITQNGRDFDGAENRDGGSAAKHNILMVFYDEGNDLHNKPIPTLAFLGRTSHVRGIRMLHFERIYHGPYKTKKNGAGEQQKSAMLRQGLLWRPSE